MYWFSLQCNWFVIVQFPLFVTLYSPIEFEYLWLWAKSEASAAVLRDCMTTSKLSGKWQMIPESLPWGIVTRLRVFEEHRCYYWTTSTCRRTLLASIIVTAHRDNNQRRQRPAQWCRRELRSWGTDKARTAARPPAQGAVGAMSEALLAPNDCDVDRKADTLCQSVCCRAHDAVSDHPLRRRSCRVWR